MSPPTQFPGYFDTSSLITIVCAALAGYNAFELVLLIFYTFNQYRGLYFWSIVIATSAIFPYTIGMEIMYFRPSAKLPGLIINNIGWICLLVAQSLVLYSRLGIVLGNMKSRILSFVKWLIIIDSFVFYVLATVVVFGMQYSKNRVWSHIYPYTERIQMTGFCLQEFFISGLYIWKTLDILKVGEKKQAHRTLYQLVFINIIIVALDIALLAVEYSGYAVVEIAFKALAYSVKLKLEFAILNKLVETSSLAQRTLSTSFNNTLVLTNDGCEDVLSPSCDLAGSNIPPNSDHIPTTPHPGFNDKTEKSSGKHFENETRSHESLRTTSHQTENSEQHLMAQSMTRSTSTYARSDSYHDIIRFMNE